MCKTEFQSENKNFSDIAHKIAAAKIYTKFLNKPLDDLTFQECNLAHGGSGAILDGSYGIDRIARIPWGRDKISITFQERFRRDAYIGRQDITITEWNWSSGLPSEMYKMVAQYFLYGFYNEKTEDFPFACIVDVGKMMRAFARDYETNKEIPRGGNQKNQTFAAIPFGFLKKHQLVVFSYRNGEFSFDF